MTKNTVHSKASPSRLIQETMGEKTKTKACVETLGVMQTAQPTLNPSVLPGRREINHKDLFFPQKYTDNLNILYLQ